MHVAVYLILVISCHSWHSIAQLCLVDLQLIRVVINMLAVLCESARDLFTHPQIMKATVI